MPLSRLKIRWGYLIAFLLLLSSYFLIFYIIGVQINASKEVTHSYSIVNNLEAIKGEITDAETGVRGYAITKDERFLEPYHSGSKHVIPLYNELVSITKTDFEYNPRIDSLGKLINRRLATLDFAVNEFQKNGVELTDVLIARREQSKGVMDSIRLLIAQMKEKEEKKMLSRNEKLNSIIISTEVITIMSLIITILTIFYSVMIYNTGNKARLAADKQAREYALQLEERVNELKKVNVELEELKSLEKFTSTGRIARTIAHEVRNPLTNITLAAEQLKDFAVSNGEAEVLLNMVSRNADRINQLVSDLLHSTRFGLLEFKPASINDIIDETLELAADRIELKKVTILKEFDDNICEVWVDSEKIKFAFLNIIVNALEAMEAQNGVLKIRSWKQGKKCFVEFKDNGIGMDEDTLQKLFDPYFSKKPKGNGLGLTNTQNIVLNHKGNINVRSTSGIGTSFIVMIPVIHSDG